MAPEGGSQVQNAWKIGLVSDCLGGVKVSDMLTLTDAAILRLKALMLEHPHDPIVRITLTDLNDEKLVFSITLEDRIQPGDIIRECEGLTVAVSGDSAPRTDGVTLDYQEPQGFRFLHPPEEESDLLGKLSLN